MPDTSLGTRILCHISDKQRFILPLVHRNIVGLAYPFTKDGKKESGVTPQIRQDKDPVSGTYGHGF